MFVHQDLWLSSLRKSGDRFASVKDVKERGVVDWRVAGADLSERSSGSHTAFRVVADNWERGSGVDLGGMTMTPTGQMGPGLIPNSGRDEAAERGWVEVFRLLCWYVRCVPFALPADLRMQYVIDLAGPEKTASNKERTRKVNMSTPC